MRTWQAAELQHHVSAQHQQQLQSTLLPHLLVQRPTALAQISTQHSPQKRVHAVRGWHLPVHKLPAQASSLDTQHQHAHANLCNESRASTLMQ
jgi:hypothetical protein